MLPPPPPPPPPFEYEDLTAATPPKKKEVIVHCRAGGKQQYTNAYIYFKVAAVVAARLILSFSLSLCDTHTHTHTSGWRSHRPRRRLTAEDATWRGFETAARGARVLRES
jgi:hypothetical protein